MATADLSFNILTKYQDRGVKQATKDFDGLRVKTVAIGSFIGQAMFGATKSVVGFAKNGLGSAITEAREAGKVTRITENVIRSTGGAANISAAQVGKLAESLSNKTAIDDELVQSGANLLLTFKNIRNEAGKGNDIFNQATAAALDLSAAGFGSVESASKMLGKALNDPLKGITALSRAGVTFTDGQKKQIKALVESGNVLGAQKIIMQEVASQVGGAAKAAADPMQRLGVIAANMKERIGTALLPIIGKVAEWLGKKLPGALDKASLGFRALGAAFREGDVTSDGFVGAMERIGVVLRTAWLGIKALVAAFREGDVTSDGFVGVMERIGVAARQVAGLFTTQIVPAISGFLRGMRDGTGAGGLFAGILTRMAKAGAATVAFFAKHTTLLKTLAATIGVVVVVTKLHTLAMAAQTAGGMIAFLVTYLKSIKLVQVATKVWTAVTWALGAAMKFALGPIGLVILGTTALVAGLVIAYKQSDRFRAIVQATWRGIQQAASFAWSRVLKPTFAGIVTGLRVGWVAFQAYARVVGSVWSGVGRAASAVWGRVLKPVFGFIGAGLRVGWTVFRTYLRAVQIVWSGVGRAASVAWRNVLSPVFRFIGIGLRAGWAVFQVYSRVVGGVWGAVGRGISRVWTGVINPVFRAVRGGVIAVRNTFNSVVTAIGRAWGRLTGIIASPARAAAAFINRRVIANVNRFTRPFGLTIPSIPRFARGGKVPGQGVGDKVPALLEPGEYVIRKKRVRELGVKAMDWLNEGVQKFATGGIVFPLPKGSYRVGQGPSGHGYQAQDYPAPLGTRIGSIMAGIVRAATAIRNARGELVSYGRYVAVRHANAFESTYAHMQRIMVGVGQRVAAGQQIGTVDSTGNSTGNHLHLEIRQNGTRINPANFLANARSPQGILGGSLVGAATGFVRSQVAKAAGLVLNPLKGLLAKTIGTKGFRGVLSKIGGTAIDRVLAWLRGKDAERNAANAISFAGSPNAAANTRGGAVALGRQMAAARGWTGAQWQALYALWQGESGWNPRADNPTSTAWGIPQFLASTARAYGIGAREPDAGRQIAAGLRYISDRYGTPANAYGAWRNRSPHWYDKGGMLPPGLSMAYNGTGKPEMVLPEGKLVRLFTASLRSAVVPWLRRVSGQLTAVGAALVTGARSAATVRPAARPAARAVAAAPRPVARLATVRPTAPPRRAPAAVRALAAAPRPVARPAARPVARTFAATPRLRVLAAVPRPRAFAAAPRRPAAVRALAAAPRPVARGFAAAPRRASVAVRALAAAPRRAPAATRAFRRGEAVIPAHRNRGGGATVHHHYHFPNYVGDKNDLVRALEDLRRQRRLPKAG